MTGVPVITAQALRTAHAALAHAETTNNRELKNAAETVMSALALHIKNPYATLDDRCREAWELIEQTVK